jgi:hypothetical protein
MTDQVKPKKYFFTSHYEKNTVPTVPIVPVVPKVPAGPLGLAPYTAVPVVPIIPKVCPEFYRRVQSLPLRVSRSYQGPTQTTYNPVPIVQEVPNPLRAFHSAVFPRLENKPLTMRIIDGV